jgi:hypothetical protein
MATLIRSFLRVRVKSSARNFGQAEGPKAQLRRSLPRRWASSCGHASVLARGLWAEQMSADKMSQRSTSRYEMGQTTRSEWESDMRAHRELLRNVIEEHREGRDGVTNWGEVLDELALPEEMVYAPVSTLGNENPPMMAQGPSGWIYHSTSLGCLRPHHFARRVCINIVESPIFDPIILLTIMCNCSTMAWSSPMDEGGDWKEEFLAVRSGRPHHQPAAAWLGMPMRGTRARLLPPLLLARCLACRAPHAARRLRLSRTARHCHRRTRPCCHTARASCSPRRHSRGHSPPGVRWWNGSTCTSSPSSS